MYTDTYDKKKYDNLFFEMKNIILYFRYYEVPPPLVGLFTLFPV